MYMRTLTAPWKTLRTFNNYLTVVVVGFALYLILLPFLPNLSLILSNWTDNTNGIRYQGVLASSQGEDKNENLVDAPKDNRLVLPSIQLDEEIIVGDDPSNVNLGVWHRPRSSTPDKGGNTVLVGHRFTYSDPATFYHLDKVDVGDRFAIWWESEEYVYEVLQTKVVGATAIEIEENTEEPIVTLYTCTPVWTAENRLVIRAALINTEVLDEAS